MKIPFSLIFYIRIMTVNAQKNLIEAMLSNSFIIHIRTLRDLPVKSSFTLSGVLVIHPSIFHILFLAVILISLPEKFNYLTIRPYFITFYNLSTDSLLLVIFEAFASM